MVPDSLSTIEAAPAESAGRLGAARTGPRRRRFLLVWAACWAPMAVWWLALLPGGMSGDSLDSWQQVVSGSWWVSQPPPFTGFMWLTSGAGTTPATTSLAETLLLSAALAFLVESLAGVVGGRRWVLGAALALLVLPLLGPFSVMLWKDVPESAALFVLAGLLLRAVSAPPAQRRAWWVGLAAVSLAAALFRWNGVATVLVVAVVAVVVLPRGLRLRAGATMAVAGLVGFGVLVGLPGVTSVQPLQTIDTMGTKLADLAQYARHDPGIFTASDRRVLEEVAPFGRWRGVGRNCYTVDPVVFFFIEGEHRLGRLDAAAPALDRLWRRVVVRDPGRFLLARACRASLAWRPVDAADDYPILTVGAGRTGFVGVAANSFGIHQVGPAPLRRAADAYAAVSVTRWFQDIFWRPAVWVLGLLAVFLALARRRLRGRALVAVLAVPLGMLVSYAVLPAAQDARYTYAAVVVCQLGVAAVLGRWWHERRRHLPRHAQTATRDTAS